MKIRTKILIGFLVVTSLVIIINALAFRALHSFKVAYGDVERETLPIVSAVQDIRFAGQRILTAANEYGFIKAEIDNIKLSGGLAIGSEMVSSLEKEEEELMDVASEELMEAMSTYKNLVLTNFSDEQEFLEQVFLVMRKLENTSLDIITMKRQNISGAAILIEKEKLEKLEDEFLDVLNSILLHEKRELEDRHEKIEKISDSALREMFVVGFLIIVLGIFASLILADNILRPISSMNRVISLVDQGHLDERVSIHSNDEVAALASSFNDMLASLEKKQGEIQTGTLIEKQELEKVQHELENVASQQIQTEKSKQQYENTFWALANNIGIGIALINKDMKVVGVNTLLKKWFPDCGTKGECHCFEILHNPPQQIICPECPVHASFLNGKSHKRLTRMDIGNQQRDIQIISVPIADEQGDIVYAIEMFGDVTKKTS